MKLKAETELKGRVALVTGASSGIGRAIALALGAAAVRVTVCARRRDRLEAVAESIRATGGEVQVETADFFSGERDRCRRARCGRSLGWEAGYFH